MDKIPQKYLLVPTDNDVTWPSSHAHVMMSPEDNMSAGHIVFASSSNNNVMMVNGAKTSLTILQNNNNNNNKQQVPPQSLGTTPQGTGVVSPESCLWSTTNSNNTAVITRNGMVTCNASSHVTGAARAPSSYAVNRPPPPKNRVPLWSDVVRQYSANSSTCAGESNESRGPMRAPQRRNERRRGAKY